ncbi:MAG: indolepyruvate oxidoreductase subunit beta [Geobacteraceae bacterium]|nr:indolepyruvate oxidoreductase subunit beta [Geobacteraceae bacterium]
MISQQLILSGVGGQGILFITRLLAETAIAKGLQVMTSETHGMAQRGGIVISHLKVGGFSSPLVQPGRADGLIALKPENAPLHRHFLNGSGWIGVNAASSPEGVGDLPVFSVPADAIALEMKAPRSVNLIVLGRVLAEAGRMFCCFEDVCLTLEKKLAPKPALLQSSLGALRAGADFAKKEVC